MTQPEGKIYPLKSNVKLQALMSNYNRDLNEAKAAGKKIAWGSGAAPMDLLLAMDIIPAYPENFTAICGASHVGTQLCQAAEQEGYSPDLCSYSRATMGACFLEDPDNFKVPVQPKPDIIMLGSQCNTHVKWWEAMGRYYNVPVMILDTPFKHDNLSEDDNKQAVRYIERQLKDMVKFISEFSGRPYNYDRLQEVIFNTSRASQLYGDFVNLGRSIPSPITAFDIFANIGPLMTARGFREPVEFYEGLVAETRERVSQGISAIGTERYRLYLDNLPVWYRVGWLARKLAAQGAATVAAVYPWTWINSFGNLDPEHPIESMAVWQHQLLSNCGTGWRIRLLSKLIEDFSVDGILAQLCISCKAFVPDQAVIIREVQKLTGLPAIFTEGDMVDERYFDESKVSQQLEDFFTIMKTKLEKAGKAGT
ncbi:MAG: 2-hydroxyacyl-CoA dehydratase subunit D [Smithellaceae bacterium]